MPPHPRDRPALERSLPSDAAPGGEAVYEPWECLFGDGRWHLVRVRGRRKDVRGRVVVDVEWHIGGESWGEAYVFDAERMRQLWGIASTASRRERTGCSCSVLSLSPRPAS